MANTIASHTLNDGPRNAVIKVTIIGDNSGDETATSLLDVSGLSTWRGQACSGVSIARLQGALGAFDVHLLWDADTDVLAAAIPSGETDLDMRGSPLPNNAGTGVTGDIMLTTIGLAVETGTFIMHLKKHYQ